MADKTLTEKVEIERGGQLMMPPGISSYNWVLYRNQGTRQGADTDIARAAIKAGYGSGDYFTYKVIIEPKKD